MAANQFEDSRIASGTLKPGAQKIGETSVTIPDESLAISRDDVRDGFAASPAAGNANPRDSNQPRILSADSLVGTHVRNATGEDLGTVDQIMIDVQANRVAYAVVSVGGFLGIGAKLVAVPWGAFGINEGEHKEIIEFILHADRKTLEDAPAFDRGTWPDMTDPAFGDQIHRHYGQTPYWTKDFTDAGDFVGDTSGHTAPRNRSAEYEQTTNYHAGTGR